MKRKISCEIVADSIDGRGNRITSAIFTFPRYILAELNTHRMLSKNSASSRAIPFKRMVQSVMDDPFIPIAWQKDHPGMQGTEYFTEKDLMKTPSGLKPAIEVLTNSWLTAREDAVGAAQSLNSLGLTKQLCNRVLEPFLWHRVLVTGTEWPNFFALRAHPDAEIHIAKLADEALKAFNESTPKLLKEGEWHIPFGDNMDGYDLLFRHWTKVEHLKGESEMMQELMVRVAIARCARVSYDNFDGTQDYEKDLELFDRLFARNPIHASPAEHVARCMYNNEYYSNYKGTLDDYAAFEDEGFGWCRNFRGFIQYRTLLNNDTIYNDERLDNKN